MKKTNAVLVLLALLILTGISWGAIYNNQITGKKELQQYLSTADKYMDKKIYIDALENYQKAFELSPKNYNLAMKIVDAYIDLGDEDGMIKACDDAISINNKDILPYNMKIDCYLKDLKYDKAYAVLDDAKNVDDQKKLKELTDNLHTKYVEKLVGTQEISDWYYQKDSDYVAAFKDDKWGLIDKNGSFKINPKFEYLGAYSEKEGVIPCKKDGEYYYIDISGNRKLIGDKDYQYLGTFSYGYAPAEFNNKYGYITRDFKESNFEYDYAGAFSNGVAAVQKQGKWALINDKLKVITDFGFDEILVDKNGFCDQFGVIVAKIQDKYYMIGADGKKLSETGFEGMKMAASKDGLMAVKQGEKWGYANTKGEMIIQPAYEDANSFSLGFAPAKKGEKWGFIDQDCKTVVEFDYDSAESFSPSGVAKVKNSISWRFIQLCQYQ